MSDTIASVNDRPCLRAQVRLPRAGVWIADLVVDGAGAIEGRAVLQLGELELVGTASRTGIARDTATLRVLGGAGGLAREVPAKFYRRAPVKALLGDILAAAGEQLADTVSAALLSRQLFAYVQTKQKAADALRALADRLGVTWRVLPNGRIWLGEESWAESTASLELISENPGAGVAEFGTDTPTLLPGVKVGGRKVSQVEHVLEPTSIRTKVWFEGESGVDRMMAAVGAVVRHLTAHVDYFAHYPAKVVSQNGDGTLELQPDGDRLPGLSKVPIRYGLPGIAAKVRPGGRVLVAFEGGDPAAPVATVWESGALAEVTVRADTKAVVVAPQVDIGGVGATVNVGGEGATVNLGGSVLGVARLGDTVQAGPFPGTITKASTQVKTGAA